MNLPRNAGSERTSLFSSAQESSVQRAKNLRWFFRDIIDSTPGIPTEEKLAKAGYILDLGVGTGAVGAFLGEMSGGNTERHLIGIDITKYQNADYHNLYTQIVTLDLTSQRFLHFLQSIPQQDLIIGFGLPPEVILHLTQMTELREAISSTGMCMFVSEYTLEGNDIAPFVRYEGTAFVDKSILVYSPQNI